MNPERLSQLTACQEPVVRLYHTLDRCDYTDASRCFMPDGIWDRGSYSLRGNQEILDTLNKRPATLFTRHYVSNFVILEYQGDTAKAACSLTVYRSDKGEPPKLPLTETTPAMLADVDADLTRSASGEWLIQRLEATLTFAA